MKHLMKCPKCFSYALSEECRNCGVKTERAGYKFKNYSE